MVGQFNPPEHGINFGRVEFTLSPDTMQHLLNSIDGVLKCLNEFSKRRLQRLLVNVPSLTQSVEEYP